MTKLTRSFIILCILLCSSVIGELSAQSNHTDEELKNMTFGQRLYYGGGVGAGFGTITSIQLMPIVGYRIMHRWSAGVGVNYQYYRDSRPPVFETHIYGGNVHTRVYVWDQFFAHSELEALSLETYDRVDFTIRRRIVPAWFVGAGYFMPIGARSGMTITFLYDLIQDIYSPYPGNFTLRIGFSL